MANVHINLYKVGTVVLYYDEKHVPDNSGMVVSSTTFQDESGLTTQYEVLPTDRKGHNNGEKTLMVQEGSIFAEITL